jgi:hypothetical protein
MKLFSKSKGFIGPIGDDLPSLIPIVVSLVLFFTIFALTLTTYNSKNIFIEKQMNMTSVAREIKGDSLFLDVSQFQSRCSAIQVKKYPYNFMVGIYPSENDLRDAINDFTAFSDEYSSPLDLHFLVETVGDEMSGTPVAYSCKYLRVGATPFDSRKASNYLVRYYPVAVQYKIPSSVSPGKPDYIIIPAVMAMVVWG